MSQGLASAGGGVRRSYGATSDTLPEVVYAGGNGGTSGGQFSPTEMYDLSENITSNIYAISSSWKQMEEKIKTIGTPKDSASFRESLHLTQSKCNQIISQTTKDLHRLTSIVRRGDKQQKLQVDRLKTSFSEAVQTYSKIQKQIAEKRKCHPITTPSEIAQSDDSEPSAAEREQQMMIEQKRIMQDLEFDQGLLIEREQRFKMIEDDIVDVAQIMKELAAMAYEQNEPINLTEYSIETSYNTVEAGNEQLEKAAASQNKQRKLTCILLGVSIVVGIILAIVISVSLH